MQLRSSHKYIFPLIFFLFACASGQKGDPRLQARLDRSPGKVAGKGWAVAVSADGAIGAYSLPYIQTPEGRQGGVVLVDGTKGDKNFLSNRRDDLMGASFAFSSDMKALAAGAPAKNMVHLFTKDHGWKSEGNKVGFWLHGDPGSGYGTSVALSTKTLVIGAPDQGQVRYLLASKAGWSSLPGIQIMLLGDTISFLKDGNVIEAPKNAPQPRAGFLGAPTAGAAAHFGKAVAISEDDSTIIVGAPDDVGGGTVYIF